MPVTIAGARDTTRVLGIRCGLALADALCIVQDDSDDWIAEVARMRDVYRNPAITVRASDQAKDSDRPFRARRCGSVKMPWYGNCKLFPEYVYMRESGSIDLADFGSTSWGLNTRGRCLREFLLAPRTLCLGRTSDGNDVLPRAIPRERPWRCEAGSDGVPTRDIHKQIKTGSLKGAESEVAQTCSLRALRLPLTLRLLFLTLNIVGHGIGEDDLEASVAGVCGVRVGGEGDAGGEVLVGYL